MIMSSKRTVTKVRLVDVGFDTSELANLLKDIYGCEILSEDSGKDDDIGGEEIVHIFSDFDSEAFREFVERSPEKLVISSTLVRSSYRQSEPLPFPRPRRPLYCEFLKNYNIVARASNQAEQSSWASIIRYMGGHVRQTPDTNTSFLVTDIAGGKAYRRQVSLGQKVLLPSWLEECWAHRDDLEFDPTNSEIISKYRIGVFEKLKIFVYGFSPDEEKDIKENVLQNRGLIVEDSLEATYCVVGTSTLDPSSLPTFKDQLLVTNEWVWTSINAQYCAKAEPYHPGPPYPQNAGGRYHPRRRHLPTWRLTALIILKQRDRKRVTTEPPIYACEYELFKNEVLWSRFSILHDATISNLMKMCVLPSQKPYQF
ncbi:hypothetical protein KIN20_003517 [Parelaphostrongylus tenuis]|uniref:BRCT domain-containing protein n=1 Tax=Parelaphostrongylus tenuis TaxID=148309 RepID=A0AAD5MIH8_PARTN|nr:hypothetical protein KIN20_003517 [Parelaphostrongylus tenuis]